MLQIEKFQLEICTTKFVGYWKSTANFGVCTKSFYLADPDPQSGDKVKHCVTQPTKSKSTANNRDVLLACCTMGVQSFLNSIRYKNFIISLTGFVP